VFNSTKLFYKRQNSNVCFVWAICIYIYIYNTRLTLDPVNGLDAIEAQVH